MPETPPLLEDGTNGKKPKLLGDGRMPLRKQILLGIGGLVAVALIGVGLYIALHKPSYTANNTAKTSTIPNNATDDELPDSAPLNDIDDASLAQDLTSITGAVAVGESDDGTAGTVLNDKSNEINIKTEAAAGEAAGNRLSRIKSAGDSEIARRLDALNRAITAVNGSPHLSAVNQDTLSNELGTEVAGLAALRIKLAAETTPAAAAADIASMVTEYRVYALLMPKARLLRAADNQIVVEQKLDDIHTKLETRISQAETKGKNVDALKSQLGELDSHITAARDLSTSAENGLLPLQPTDYNNDHSILSAYRDKIKTAHTHNKTAANLAKQIVQALKSAQ